MKRNEVEAKIKEVFGEEVDAKSFVDFIMAENGKDIQAIKTASTRDLLEATQAKEAAEAELKAYQQGGEHYVDQTEFERLKKFESDTLSEQKTAKTKAALLKLLDDSKASPAIKELLVKAIDLDAVKFKDDGSIENADEIIKPLKESYPMCFTSVKQKTGAPSNPPAHNPAGGASGEPKSLKEALNERYTGQ